MRILKIIKKVNIDLEEVNYYLDSLKTGMIRYGYRTGKKVWNHF